MPPAPEEATIAVAISPAGHTTDTPAKSRRQSIIESLQKMRPTVPSVVRGALSPRWRMSSASNSSAAESFGEGELKVIDVSEPAPPAKSRRQSIIESLQKLRPAVPSVVRSGLSPRRRANSAAESSGDGDECESDAPAASECTSQTVPPWAQQAQREREWEREREQAQLGGPEHARAAAAVDAPVEEEAGAQRGGAQVQLLHGVGAESAAVDLRVPLDAQSPAASGMIRAAAQAALNEQQSRRAMVPAAADHRAAGLADRTAILAAARRAVLAHQHTHEQQQQRRQRQQQQQQQQQQQHEPKVVGVGPSSPEAVEQRRQQRKLRRAKRLADKVAAAAENESERAAGAPPAVALAGAATAHGAPAAAAVFASSTAGRGRQGLHRRGSLREQLAQAAPGQKAALLAEARAARKEAMSVSRRRASLSAGIELSMELSMEAMSVSRRASLSAGGEEEHTERGEEESEVAGGEGRGARRRGARRGGEHGGGEQGEVAGGEHGGGATQGGDDFARRPCRRSATRSRATALREKAGALRRQQDALAAEAEALELLGSDGEFDHFSRSSPDPSPWSGSDTASPVAASSGLGQLCAVSRANRRASLEMAHHHPGLSAPPNAGAGFGRTAPNVAKSERHPQRQRQHAHKSRGAILASARRASLAVQQQSYQGQQQQGGVAEEEEVAEAAAAAAAERQVLAAATRGAHANGDSHRVPRGVERRALSSHVRGISTIAGMPTHSQQQTVRDHPGTVALPVARASAARAPLAPGGWV